MTSGGLSVGNFNKADILVPVFSDSKLSSYTDLLEDKERKGLGDYINEGLESLGRGVGTGVQTDNIKVGFDFSDLIVPIVSGVIVYFLVKSL